MPQFTYQRLHTMEPRPGRRYSTTYIKQSPQEYQRLRSWLIQIADGILATCELDPGLAEWFTRPMEDFRKSTRGQYYTPEELLTDMIHQMSLGRDLAQAMLYRWNRLTEATPWQIELVEAMTAEKR
jgi:hypothetical protein